MNFDELNELGLSLKDVLKELGGEELDYDEYFSIMELPEEEKENRKELAKKLAVIFLVYFFLHQRKGELGFDYESMISEKYKEVAIDFLKLRSIPSYIEKHANDLTDEVIKTTQKHDGEVFYISKDRSSLIGANEANLIGNYNQYIQAIRRGKKYKTWITERDNKVRRTHKEVDGKKIGIFELFQVGDSVMGYPKDMTHSPNLEEISGCRCVVEYS